MMNCTTHCWHFTHSGPWSSILPPPMICCHCGISKGSEHGPFKPTPNGTGYGIKWLLPSDNNSPPSVGFGSIKFTTGTNSGGPTMTGYGTLHTNTGNTVKFIDSTGKSWDVVGNTFSLSPSSNNLTT